MTAIRVELDWDAQAAYIEFGDNPVARTVEVDPDVQVDLDEYGVAVGIELLRLDPALLRRSAINANCHIPVGVWEALQTNLSLLGSMMTSSSGERGTAGSGQLTFA